MLPFELYISQKIGHRKFFFYHMFVVIDNRAVNSMQFNIYGASIFEGYYLHRQTTYMETAVNEERKRQRCGVNNCMQQ